MPTFKPPSPPFIGARYKGGAQKPKAIVMHGTVSSDNPGTARNIANWWKGITSPKSSCHYVVDPRETIQCVGDHTVAFHCGYNTGSIGVELCDEQTGPASRWSDADSQAIIKRAARLVAELCLAYDISPSRPSIASLKKKGPHGIYGHNDSRLAFGKTTHTDPRDFPWKQFLKLVKVEVAAIKKGAKVKPPATKSRWRTAVDKVLGRTSITLQTVTANVGTKAAADTFKRAATGCQLGGLQEVDTAADVRNAQTALKNHGYNGRSGDGQHNVGIVYDKKLFRHVNSGYRKHFDGESGISHTRHMLWVELELIEDPSKHIILVASHYPPAAFWPGGQQRTSGDRIPKRVAMWEQAQAAEVKLLTELAAKGHPMVTFSDANRQKVSRLPAAIAGRKTHAISNALDWIIYIDGAKATWAPHEVVKVDINSPGHPALQNRATLRFRR